MPKMTNLPLILILRPFRGDQLIIALNARHPKFGTTIGKYRRHGNLPHSPSLRCEVATDLGRLDWAKIRILIKSKSFLFPYSTPTEYKEALCDLFDQVIVWNLEAVLVYACR